MHHKAETLFKKVKKSTKNAILGGPLKPVGKNSNNSPGTVTVVNGKIIPNGYTLLKDKIVPIGYISPDDSDSDNPNSIASNPLNESNYSSSNSLDDSTDFNLCVSNLLTLLDSLKSSNNSDPNNIIPSEYFAEIPKLLRLSDNLKKNRIPNQDKSNKKKSNKLKNELETDARNKLLLLLPKKIPVPCALCNIHIEYYLDSEETQLRFACGHIAHGKCLTEIPKPQPPDDIKNNPTLLSLWTPPPMTEIDCPRCAAESARIARANAKICNGLMMSSSDSDAGAVKKSKKSKKSSRSTIKSTSNNTNRENNKNYILTNSSNNSSPALKSPKTPNSITSLPIPKRQSNITENQIQKNSNNYNPLCLETNTTELDISPISGSTSSDLSSHNFTPLSVGTAISSSTTISKDKFYYGSYNDSNLFKPLPPAPPPSRPPPLSPKSLKSNISLRSPLKSNYTTPLRSPLKFTFNDPSQSPSLKSVKLAPNPSTPPPIPQSIPLNQLIIEANGNSNENKKRHESFLLYNSRTPEENRFSFLNQSKFQTTNQSPQLENPSPSIAKKTFKNLSSLNLNSFLSNKSKTPIQVVTQSDLKTSFLIDSQIKPQHEIQIEKEIRKEISTLGSPFSPRKAPPPPKPINKAYINTVNSPDSSDAEVRKSKNLQEDENEQSNSNSASENDISPFVKGITAYTCMSLPKERHVVKLPCMINVAIPKMPTLKESKIAKKKTKIAARNHAKLSKHLISNWTKADPLYRLTRKAALSRLEEISDFKSVNHNSLGKLRLWDYVTVSTEKDYWIEVEAYLFENVLLLFSRNNPSKAIDFSDDISLFLRGLINLNEITKYVRNNILNFPTRHSQLIDIGVGLSFGNGEALSSNYKPIDEEINDGKATVLTFKSTNNNISDLHIRFQNMGILETWEIAFDHPTENVLNFSHPRFVPINGADKKEKEKGIVTGIKLLEPEGKPITIESSSDNEEYLNYKDRIYSTAYSKDNAQNLVLVAPLTSGSSDCSTVLPSRWETIHNALETMLIQCESSSAPTGKLGLVLYNIPEDSASLTFGSNSRSSSVDETASQTSKLSIGKKLFNYNPSKLSGSSSNNNSSSPNLSQNTIHETRPKSLVAVYDMQPWTIQDWRSVLDELKNNMSLSELLLSKSNNNSKKNLTEGGSFNNLGNRFEQYMLNHFSKYDYENNYRSFSVSSSKSDSLKKKFNFGTAKVFNAEKVPVSSTKETFNSSLVALKFGTQLLRTEYCENVFMSKDQANIPSISSSIIFVSESSESFSTNEIDLSFKPSIPTTNSSNAFFLRNDYSLFSKRSQIPTIHTIGVNHNVCSNSLIELASRTPGGTYTYLSNWEQLFEVTTGALYTQQASALKDAAISIEVQKGIRITSINGEKVPSTITNFNSDAKSNSNSNSSVNISSITNNLFGTTLTSSLDSSYNQDKFRVHNGMENTLYQDDSNSFLDIKSIFANNREKSGNDVHVLNVGNLAYGCQKQILLELEIEPTIFTQAALTNKDFVGLSEVTIDLFAVRLLSGFFEGKKGSNGLEQRGSEHNKRTCIGCDVASINVFVGKNMSRRLNPFSGVINQEILFRQTSIHSSNELKKISSLIINGLSEKAFEKINILQEEISNCVASLIDYRKRIIRRYSESGALSDYDRKNFGTTKFEVLRAQLISNMRKRPSLSKVMEVTYKQMSLLDALLDKASLIEKFVNKPNEFLLNEWQTFKASIVMLMWERGIWADCTNGNNVPLYFVSQTDGIVEKITATNSNMI